MLLSIVIPCYNEEQVLPESIRRIEKVVTMLQDVVRTFDKSKYRRIFANKSDIIAPPPMLKSTLNLFL